MVNYHVIRVTVIIGCNNFHYAIGDNFIAPLLPTYLGLKCSVVPGIYLTNERGFYARKQKQAAGEKVD